MYTQTCPDCNGKFSHERESISKRLLSIHRRKVHGVITKTMQAQAAYRAQKAGQVSADRAKMLSTLEKARTARWAKRLDPVLEAPLKSTQMGAPWWQSPGGSNQAITCPCCQAQFVIIKGSKE